MLCFDDLVDILAGAGTLLSELIIDYNYINLCKLEKSTDGFRYTAVNFLWGSATYYSDLFSA